MRRLYLAVVAAAILAILGSPAPIGTFEAARCGTLLGRVRLVFDRFEAGTNAVP